MSASDFRLALLKHTESFVSLSPEQLALLEGHYNLLQSWNRRLNLTRIEELTEVVERHYCESLYLAKWLPVGGWKIVDIGTGPGFPGIPLGILRPECQVTLVEAHKRKAVFLREAIRPLPNLRVEAVRAQALRTNFDWAVSRAVDPAEVAALDIAPNAALLIGSNDAKALGWEVQGLPWGRGRVIAFHVER